LVKKGPYRIEIETTGQLEARNSVLILGPSQLIDFRIWQVSIQTLNIIEKGTVVKKGDWLAWSVALRIPEPLQ
jgi:HlyD family secretion protein